MARTDPRPNYGSKRRVKDNGYIDIYEPTHPIARADGYVYEHRKVAWDHGIITDKAQEVHHINEDKADNRPENLMGTMRGAHQSLHLSERGYVNNQFGGPFPIGQHGRVGTYCRGCRCDDCRRANTEAKRRYEAKRRGVA